MDMAAAAFESGQSASNGCVVCGAPRSRYSFGPGKCRKCYVSTATSRNLDRLRYHVEEESPYIENHKQYLKQFTVEQRARFRELMASRCGKIAKAEAVDIVMREPKPGVCCPKCAAHPERCGPDTHGIQSTWLRLMSVLEDLCNPSLGV